jgi:cytoskeletal protein CcmA (bactofilin family)
VINDQDFKRFNYNVLGEKSVITGDLILHGDTVVNSVIHGTLEVRGEGKLVLERGCSVKGKIKAVDMEIFGEVEGEIFSSGLVSIRSSGKVTGTIKSSRLVIYPGAEVEMEAKSE